ncbi:MAG: DinB/UmuC family translesion DNA polymerase [Shinella sp.]
MERLGILTGADLKAKSIVFLQEHFGKAGAWYYDISRGIDHRSVQPDRPLKSVGVEDTFSVDIVDLEAARAELTPLAAEVWRRCESKELHGRTATLKVKYADFQIITRSRTMTGPIATADDLETLGQSLLEPLFPTAKGIRLLGLTLSSFSDAEVSEANQLELQI